MSGLKRIVVSVLALAVVSGIGPQNAFGITARIYANTRAYNDDGGDPILIYVREITGIQGRADIYLAAGLPSGQIVGFDGHGWGVVWDGSQVFLDELRPVRTDISLPISDWGDGVDVLRGEIPPGAPTGSYVFYVLLVRSGQPVGDSSNWLLPVFEWPFRIHGPLPIAPFITLGKVEILQIRLRAMFLPDSGISVGCHIEMSARNLSKDYVDVGLGFQLFDFDGNGLGGAYAGGSLNGGQSKVLTGLAPATDLPAGADCSGIGSVQLPRIP